MTDQKLKIMLTGVTDVGRERELNEDGFALCPDVANPQWSLTPTYKPFPLSEQVINFLIS